MNARFARIGLAAALCATIGMAAPYPAHAQLGGLFRPRTPAPDTPDGCEQGQSASSGSRVLGGIVGGLAGDLARRARIPVYLPVDLFADQISSAIACKLDPKEQEQAAEATLAATRRGDGSEDGAGDDGAQIGRSASWTSTSRADVSGTSTVVARDARGTEGLDCITVSDVIIVAGEETRADKRMCRRPPAARYAIAA